MKKSSEYNTASNLAILLEGQPKSGKTRLAMCFPKPAVLDCDGNLAGAIRTGVDDFLFDDPNVDENGKKLESAASWKKCNAFMKEAIQLPDNECQTIIVDGLSNLSNYLIELLSSHSKLLVGGVKVMDLSLWQPFRNMMQQFILAGRASNKMLIITSHEDILVDEKRGDVVAYRPLIPGSLKQNIAGFFSDVWRCETIVRGSKVNYMCRFAPRNLMQLGNSLQITEPEIDLTDRKPEDIWGFFGKYLNLAPKS